MRFLDSVISMANWLTSCGVREVFWRVGSMLLMSMDESKCEMLWSFHSNSAANKTHNSDWHLNYWIFFVVSISGIFVRISSCPHEFVKGTKTHLASAVLFEPNCANMAVPTPELFSAEN